ncbi:pimeloyl-ACP methyl esterase BioG family protein [uncultured Bacteroides sp.]|uniref:pimeloyl-ACP methyl esterase BioG family protein n=1 Tax=uncultured Bacteroides sp. TaxID=162156 RepID=UPI0025CC9449|nr:pimeloyl-ACP methyl esterase BioG family protein [uncultured Bacteroides sp.]
MIQKFIIQERHSRLLLFFAGWGADETPFKDYRPANSDFMICYDYRNLSFDSQVLKDYEEVNVVGWSMGVWAASQVLGKVIAGETSENSRLPLGKTIAINGTPFPIDEERGIPPAIYHGTLEGLTDASLHKFLRRMCADSAAFRKFLAITPHRPLEELREELTAIETAYTTGPAYPFDWCTSVIATEDRIIPSENQKKAWTRDEKSTPFMAEAHIVIRIETAHYAQELFETYLEKVWIND